MFVANARGVWTVLATPHPGDTPALFTLLLQIAAVSQESGGPPRQRAVAGPWLDAPLPAALPARLAQQRPDLAFSFGRLRQQRAPTHKAGWERAMIWFSPYEKA